MPQLGAGAPPFAYWPTFRRLWITAVLATITVLPYVFTILKTIPLPKPLPVPLPVLAGLQLVQSAIVFGVAIAAGLWFAPRLGLRLPMFAHDYAPGGAGEVFRQAVRGGLPLGMLAGAIVIALELRFFHRYLPPSMLKFSAPAWQGLLASFYGGIGEEILLRLFVMSALAYLVVKAFRQTAPPLASAPFWVGNVVSALLFGLGHLPATAALAPLTTALVVRALVLNGIPGVMFGYLFWKRGLEAAMVAHFMADIVIQSAAAFLMP